MKIELVPFKSSLARYVISIGLVVSAFLSYRVLVKMVGGDLPTYITFYPAVIISGLFAGFGATLLATATTALIVAYWILPPAGLSVSSLPDAVGLAVFSFNGILIGVVVELYRRARQREANYAAELTLRDERKKAEEVLQKSEVRLRLAQEAAKAGAWEWDLRTNENIWSEELWKLYGLEPYCSESTYEMWLQTVHPDDRDRIEQVVQEAAAKGIELNVEWRVLDREGSLRWLMSRGRPLRDAQGRSERYIGIVMDITERKQMEVALKERSDQLEVANKELDSFTYSVSHDLRAPLRAIDGYSRMILKQQGDTFDEKTTRLFDVIRSSTKIMSKLIDDLLALSRLGREALSLSRFNMKDLTKDVWEELKAANPDRPIDLKIGQLPRGRGDRSLIKQVLVNILSNAIKFTRIREVPLIEMGGYGEATENVYYVRDNGIGFDMQYHDKLFGVFQRLHSAADYEGTGVGLAIVQRIIHRHGGRVWAESEVDKGATFYFSLPTDIASGL
jgi:PAS domain S-box-containing protein